VNGSFTNDIARELAEVLLFKMKFQRRRGVSVIVATLLLIAMSVSAAVIVYVFVSGLAGGLTRNAGQSVNEKLTMQSYNFALNPGAAGLCACSGQILEIFLANSGSSSSTISAVYFDGNPYTVSTPFYAVTAMSTLGSGVFTAPSTTTVLDQTAAPCTTNPGAAGSICFSAITTQLPYAAGAVGQIVLTFTTALAPTTGSSHTVKVVSITGATFVFTVIAGTAG